MSRCESAKISLIGDRSNNQDRCAIFSANDTYCMVLADGLGGHPKGEVAAQILVNVCQQAFTRSMKPISAPDTFMRACIQQAHQAILEYGSRQRPQIAPRTTAVAAVVQNNKVYWAHVGDSRFYLIREGSIVAQTTDHSVAQLMKTMDQPELLNAPGMNRNSITRCLGGEKTPPTPTLGSPTGLLPGDYLVLCSDGLWAQVEEEDLLDTFENADSLRKDLRKLASLAETNASPKSDNITALVLYLPALAEKDIPGTLSEDENLNAAVDQLTEFIINTKRR